MPRGGFAVGSEYQPLVVCVTQNYRIVTRFAARTFVTAPRFFLEFRYDVCWPSRPSGRELNRCLVHDTYAHTDAATIGVEVFALQGKKKITDGTLLNKIEWLPSIVLF